ncbi:MAG: 23S rRNA (adenine(2503)-C(2))-methyltransferase RlmN [Candidatus Omnitrophota bacterium]
MKEAITGFLLDDLKQRIIGLGQPGYRAKQVLEWVYKKNVISFSQMKNIPADLKQLMDEKFCVTDLITQEKLVSKDKTAKYLFRTHDGELIEAVLIPTQKRTTVCISTQAGCGYGCTFCASGIGGLKRNLFVSEIVSQVLLIEQDNPHRSITNIVIMGMGEPLANYENTLKAVRIMNSPDGIGIAARKITISTCGLPEQILHLAQEGIQVELSVSLHAANDALRDDLMPINKKYNIAKLIKTVKEYTKLTHRIVTFEYIVIGGVNDSKIDAQGLASLLKGVRCKVNLIPFNPVEGLAFDPPRPLNIAQIDQMLKDSLINVTIRRSRGVDIKGACGQLRAEVESR